MLIERVVVNASPLITLFKSQQAYLLPELFSEIVIPNAIWHEIEAGQDVAARCLSEADWLKRVTLDEVAAQVTRWGIDPGETEVLSFALQNPGYRAVIDDSAARRCAKALGIAKLGTCGVLVLAKRRGLIASVEPGLRALEEAGLWLSQDLIAQIKQQAGES